MNTPSIIVVPGRLFHSRHVAGMTFYVEEIKGEDANGFRRTPFTYGKERIPVTTLLDPEQWVPAPPLP